MKKQIISPNLKNVLLGNPISRSVYNLILDVYKKRVFAKRCKKLRANGPAIVNTIDQQLSAAGLDYFADWGTLLGVTREHDFIRHDDDLDFSVPPVHKNPYEYYKVLSKIPDLVFEKAFEWNGEIRELGFNYKGVDVDFFFMYNENEVTYSQYFTRHIERQYDDPNQWTPHRIKTELPIGLKRIAFKGGYISVPENADAILTSEYGKWRIPMKGFRGNNNEAAMGQSVREEPIGYGLVVDAVRVATLSK